MSSIANAANASGSSLARLNPSTYVRIFRIFSSPSVVGLLTVDCQAPVVVYNYIIPPAIGRLVRRNHGGFLDRPAWRDEVIGRL